MGDFNHFAQIADALEQAVIQVVKKAAFDVQSGAASRAPVATGFLKNSIYVVTNHGDNTYGQGAGGGGALLAPLDPPAGDVTAVIGVGAAYGAYVELGSRHGPAQPYLTPAAEDVRGPFVEALSRLEDALHGAGGL